MSRRTASTANSKGAGAAAASSASTAAPTPATAAMQDDESVTDDEVDADTATAGAANGADSSVPARFAGQSVYQVLGIDKTATADDIKRAYRRTALRVHPDLNKSPSATAEFQYLSRCHELLSDPRRRARYDQTGVMDDGSASGLDEDELAAAAASTDAYAYWRTLFPKIGLEDIEAYRVKYEGGEEEKEDVLAAWKQNEGDLHAVFESVPFASADSVPRICAILNSEVGAKISKAAQKKLAAELAEAEGGEAAEAEEALKELSQKEQQLMRVSMASNGKGGAAAAASGEGALALIMQNRARERAQTGHSFIAALEAKYAAGGSKAKGKSAAAAASNGTGKRATPKRKTAAAHMDDDEEGEEAEQGGEPSKEEFAAIQARMKSNKASTSATSKSPAKKSKK